MKEVETECIDKRMRMRLSFCKCQWNFPSAKLESYASKLRKGKRKEIIAERRAKVVDEESISDKQEIEMNTLIAFLKHELIFIDNPPYSVLM